MPVKTRESGLTGGDQESNYPNDLTNRPFYVAMQSFYKDKISGIEDVYAESRQGREARIKERIVVLEQQAKAIED